MSNHCLEWSEATNHADTDSVSDDNHGLSFARSTKVIKHPEMNHSERRMTCLIRLDADRIEMETFIGMNCRNWSSSKPIPREFANLAHKLTQGLNRLSRDSESLSGAPAQISASRRSERRRT
jgi:hypothetical protein